MPATRPLPLLTALAVGIWATSPTPAPAQDMMSACAPEIGQYCSNISRGRGRVLACLISREGKLSETCRTDVMAAAQRGSDNPLVPSGVRKMLTGGGSAGVPAACSTDVASLCTGTSPGADRTLACLYAHGDRVSSDCSSQIEAALR